MSPSQHPLTVYEVLVEEAIALAEGNAREDWLELLAAIRQGDYHRDAPETKATVFACLHKLERSAICLSGGGVRSATFALGILQGLAQMSRGAEGVLRSFHFMSTVSGGGYLGGWLTRWRQEAGGMDAVIHDLSATPANRLDPEPRPVSHLRMYTRYLNPRFGVTSRESWRLIGTVIRNLVLNWFVLVPLLAVVLLIPRVLVELIRFADLQRPYRSSFLYILLAAAFVFGVSAVRFVTLNLPAFGDHKEAERAYVRRGFTSALLAAVFLAVYWYLRSEHTYSVQTLLNFCAFGFAFHGLGTAIAFAQIKESGDQKLRRALKAVNASGISGAFGGLVAYLILRGTSKIAISPLYREEIFLIFSVPLVLMINWLVSILMVGLTSKYTEDADREWWDCSSAFIFMSVVGWVAATSLVFFGVKGLGAVNIKIQPVVAASGGLVAFLASKLWTSLKSLSDRDKSSGIQLLIWPLEKWLPILGFGGLAIVAIFICSTNERLIGNMASNVGLKRLAVFAIALMIEAYFVFVAAAFININKFSTHAMYRNRLMRVYLGSSRERHPNPFTGFDPADNMAMAYVNRSADGNIERPLHVINVTLNGVEGRNFALKEPAVSSFTVTTLHSGSLRTGYQPSSRYAAISLATALAISGVAASPSMGYHPSPILNAIMPFFSVHLGWWNVRLGWWLPNPGEKGRRFWRNKAPRNAIRPLLDEVFRRTDAVNEWLYLSDGGHFENLGLYEMVLRRCRTIIVVDASADPDYKFEDLANAVRKIRIDLGVSITFDKDTLPTKTNQRHCAVGRIDYQMVDGADVPSGSLIYIKPALCGWEPVDVARYASTDSNFPHQAINDQRLSEAQFESYRRLGLHTIEHIVREAHLSFGSGVSLQTFNDCAQQHMNREAKVRTPVDVRVISSEEQGTT